MVRKYTFFYFKQVITFLTFKLINFIAKLAGSILEDEDMEDEEDEIEKAVPAKIIEKKIMEVKPTLTSPQVQRQIIMGPNNQVILSPNATHQTTATIKTDSGIQSVPIIIQQPAPTIIQQPAPTQYILATNQQGQTYVVAQQPIANPPIPQTVLLAQTPGQQGQKTIIILQQPQNQHGQAIQMPQPAQQQKIIMTPSGQQVLYSSSPVQRQVQPTLIQQSPGAQIIQSAQSSNRKIVISNTAVESGKQATAATKIVQQTSQQTLQAIAQGQNIIMQKGQKYQIGSTQITQIVSPQNPPQNQNQPIAQKVSISTKSEQITTMPVTSQSSQIVFAKESSNVVVVKQSSESPTVGEKAGVCDKQVEQKYEESVEKEEVKQEEIEVKATPSQSSSGTSSPAPPPTQSKQTISIQIPVPQSQIAGPNAQQYTIKIVPSMDPSVKVKDEDVEISWPYICEVTLN